MALVRTVLGDIAPEELGVTHGHEHVLFSPAPHLGEDLQRTDTHRAIAELESFQETGGGALIDATVEELGRDAAALARISARTGIRIVAAAGHTAEEWWWDRSDPRQRSRGELIEEMTTDITVGISDTGVRAGIIKVGTSLDTITKTESRVLEAAAAVHAATGASITTHTSTGTMALTQAQRLIELGVDPGRLCIGHLDRRLEWQEHLAVARAGVYLGYDQIGKERHDPDAERAEFVSRLVAEGHGDRILLGSDLARRGDLLAWGGTIGLTHLLRSFVPRLERNGLSRTETNAILVENPGRFLAWA